MINDYRVWVRVLLSDGKVLDETLIEDEDYGWAMSRLAKWASDSEAEKNL